MPRSANVYTDFYCDVQHHHRSHTYVYFYSNKAVMITHWTFMHSVSTVNKSYFTINHVWESLKFMHLSSCKVQTVVKPFHLYKVVIATGWVYIATGQLHCAPGWMYIATGQLHSAPRWMYDLMSNKYITDVNKYSPPLVLVTILFYAYL